MKKTRNLLSGIIVMFFIFIAYGSDDDKNEAMEDKVTDQLSTDKAVSKIPLKTRLENAIKGLETDTDLTKSVQSVDGIVIVLAIYKAYAITIKEGKESTNPDEKELAKKLEAKVSNSQLKSFPKLRMVYYNIMQEKLWEHDVDIKIGGKRNTVLNLTAGYFAANNNIKSTQEALHEMLVNLRFKQINYRWYKGDDEYTYYTVESPKDSEVFE